MDRSAQDESTVKGKFASPLSYKSSTLQLNEDTDVQLTPLKSPPDFLRRMIRPFSDDEQEESSRFGTLSQTRLKTKHKSEPQSLSEKLELVEYQISRSQSFSSRGHNAYVKPKEAEANDKEDSKQPISCLKWCAFCGHEVTTSVSYVNSSRTFWASLSIFVLGGALGCFLLPYYSDSCKNVKKVCSKCDRVLT